MRTSGQSKNKWQIFRKHEIDVLDLLNIRALILIGGGLLMKVGCSKAKAPEALALNDEDNLARPKQ